MALIPYWAGSAPETPPWLVSPAAIAAAEDPQPLLAAMAQQPLSPLDRATFAREAAMLERAHRCRLPVLHVLTHWLTETP
jgi:hypothetical protein